jgi:lipopolysaccharide/colanic/teichoic acid biosynthesis glycosyltransferase
MRFFDLLFSGIAMFLLSPLLIPVIIILRFSGEGEIFYFQDRIGKDGKIFKLAKFATMLKESPNLGSGHITLRNDPRVLPIGKFLRKTKINELPQLINIFKGDMSIVGPRPLTEKNFSYYSPEAQKKISAIRPGLTGVGSIVFRDEEKYLHMQKDPVKFYKSVIAPYKSELELWYLEHQSLPMYFRLVILTALIVIFPGTKLTEKWLRDIPEMPEGLSKFK